MQSIDFIIFISVLIGYPKRFKLFKQIYSNLNVFLFCLEVSWKKTSEKQKKRRELDTNARRMKEKMTKRRKQKE